MDYDLYHWSTNLFAYLYQRYESTADARDLPVRMEYQISETFNLRAGDCQVRVNNILRKKLESVFEKNYLIVCRSICIFRAYCERACWKSFLDFHLHTSAMCLTAVVTELTFYCFQRGCYRFALFAPECLNNIIQRTILRAISKRKSSRTVKERFDSLLEICQDMLEPDGAPPNAEHKEVIRFGRTFARKEIKRFIKKNRLYKVDKLEEESEPSNNSEEEGPSDGAKGDESSGDEDKWEGSPPRKDPYEQEESDANLLAAAKPFNPNACRICREENCKRYLEEFVKRFVAGAKKYTPLE